MLSDMYPAKVRGQVMSYFYLAIPVGSALGFVIGGQIAEHFGWRTAFLVTLVGLIPAAVCFFMREPPRPVADPTAPPETPPSYMAVVRELRTVRSFMFCCAGMTCTTFMLGGVAAWTPRYVFQREAKFDVTEKTMDQLRTEKNTKGDFMVPPTVVEKLAPRAGSGEKGYAEFKGELLTRARQARPSAVWRAGLQGCNVPEFRHAGVGELLVRADRGRVVSAWVRRSSAV